MLLIDHEVSNSWHPSRNVLDLAQMTTQSGLRAWWVCSEGHEWECRIADRVLGKNKKGTGCPFCTGRQVLIGYNDLASLYPEIALQWHPTRNGSKLPSEFTVGSHTKIWWRCHLNHEWETSIKHRTGKLKTGCVYCAGNLVWAGFNDLGTTNPTLALQWHPTKNDTLLPTQVSRSSHRRVWWLGECGHEWDEQIASRNKVTEISTNIIGKCPICLGKRILVGYNDLASQNSLIAGEWHPTKNGELVATQTFTTSHKKIWWQCQLGHEWAATVESRVRGRTNCPTCSGRVILSGYNDLASQYPSIASEWHPTKNGATKPEGVYAGGKKRWWWQCKKGHEWESFMAARTRENGTNCPTCAITTFVSKAEKEISEFLTKSGFSVQQSDRSVFKNKMELDIYIPTHNLAIEFNGLYWHSEEMGKQESYHRNKWLACAKKSIELIQIWEDDWIANPTKIKEMILKSLQAPMSLDLSDWFVDPCSKDEVIGFLDSFSFHVSSLEDTNFKLVDNLGSIRAVVSYSIVNNEVNRILNYADNLTWHSSKLLAVLLSEIESRHGISSHVTATDNCTLQCRVFEGAGFVRSGEMPPAPAIMLKNKRIYLSKTQAGFVHTDELGMIHTAKKKKLIWDAGKTLWNK